MLAIGTGYLSAINAEVVLQPFLQEVVNEVGGSSSVTVLDETDIVYIAHASLNRAIRLTAGAGSRYPAYPTSMGRVLLAFQPESAIDAYFERAPLRRLTEQTETNPAALRRILKEVRTKGYAAIQDELDYGIVSVRAADLRTARPDRRGSELFGRHQPAGPRHDDQEAPAGAQAGRAPHRGHAHAAPGAHELGRVGGVRLRALARRRSRGPADAKSRAPRRLTLGAALIRLQSSISVVVWSSVRPSLVAQHHDGSCHLRCLLLIRPRPLRICASRCCPRGTRIVETVARHRASAGTRRATDRSTSSDRRPSPILNRVGVDAREALDHLERITRRHQTTVPGHANRPVEVGGLHDQRVTFPMTAREPVCWRTAGDTGARPSSGMMRVSWIIS